MTSILFVCVENAGRSQMAEAFFRKHAPEFDVSSAGTVPSNQINPVVVQVMGELGIDLDGKPKVISNLMINNSDRIVNMGCMDKEICPALFVNDVLDWNMPDPKERPIDEVRDIRDQIQIKVLDLIKSIKE